jgi:hypothetical protein
MKHGRLVLSPAGSVRRIVTMRGESIAPPAPHDNTVILVQRRPARHSFLEIEALAALLACLPSGRIHHVRRIADAERRREARTAEDDKGEQGIHLLILSALLLFIM